MGTKHDRRERSLEAVSRGHEACEPRAARRPVRHPVQRLQRIVGNRAIGRAVDPVGTTDAPATALPATLRDGVFALSGVDLERVRVHSNSMWPERVDALAYADGDDIYLAPGADRHLAHEAWHVVQQRQGRVWANAQVDGVEINDDPTLEAEADLMGARAQQAREVQPWTTDASPSDKSFAGGLGAIQRSPHKNKGKEEVRDDEAEEVARKLALDKEREPEGSVPLEHFDHAAKLVLKGKEWQKKKDSGVPSSKERTIAVWDIAQDGPWELHLSAMMNETGHHVQKFHFTLRRGPGKGYDVFSWFKIRGYNREAELLARKDEGMTGLFGHKSVPYTVAKEAKRIDEYAAKIFATARSYIKDKD